MAGESGVVKVTIEVPVEMRGKIRMAAAKNDQSMAAWIRDALNETLEIEEEER